MLPDLIGTAIWATVKDWDIYATLEAFMLLGNGMWIHANSGRCYGPQDIRDWKHYSAHSPNAYDKVD